MFAPRQQINHFIRVVPLRTAQKEEGNMNTNSQEIQPMEQSGNVSSVLTGMIIGGLVGAVTMLLLAPQPGKKTRAELQTGALELRDRTAETRRAAHQGQLRRVGLAHARHASH